MNILDIIKSYTDKGIINGNIPKKEILDANTKEIKSEDFDTILFPYKKNVEKMCDFLESFIYVTNNYINEAKASKTNVPTRTIITTLLRHSGDIGLLTYFSYEMGKDFKDLIVTDKSPLAFRVLTIVLALMGITNKTVRYDKAPLPNMSSQEFHKILTDAKALSPRFSPLGVVDNH